MEARERVRELLRAAVSRRERVLVGFDFPYGFPRGFAAALGLHGTPWQATWAYLAAKIQDGSDNRNNRFEVAGEINARMAAHVFWGRPVTQDVEHLSRRKDAVRYLTEGTKVGLPEWRDTEAALRQQRRHPHSVWKLFYNGSVGSQALVGIPVVNSLRDDPQLQALSRVWPFEAGVPMSPMGTPSILHAEIWPSIVDVKPLMARPENDGKVLDEVQVEQLALTFRRHDAAETLADLFAAAPPEVAEEEGWILGVR
jgi:hypothetical protein